MHCYSPKNLAACLATLLTVTALNSEAGVQIARGELNAQGTVEVSYSDRVSPRADSTSDVIYIFTPALIYHREGARLNINANLAAPIRRYDSVSRLNSEGIDFGINGNVPYTPGTRLSGSWSINYFEGIRSSYLTNRNLDQETFDANISTDVALRNKFSLRSSIRYSDRNSGGVDSFYLNANESTTFAIGVHAHDIRGRFGFYTEYFIRDRKTTRDIGDLDVDDTDDGVNFGFTGQILPERLFPNLEADLSFGFASTERAGGFQRDVDRSNRLTFNGSLRYPATAKINATLNMNRSMSVSDDDRTVERTRITLGADYTPSHRLGFGATVGLMQNDFLTDEVEPRNDDVLHFGLNARYLIRNNWTANAFYNFRDSSSNRELSDFQSNHFGVSTTLTY